MSREVLPEQPCPICHTNNLTLAQEETEVPYFGKLYIFSMSCSNCKFHKSDIEPAETHEPASYTFVLESEEDLKVRVVKSSEATIKIPHVMTITPGPASQGYVTNIEGVLNRVKEALEKSRDMEEDPKAKKKAKNLLKKIQRAMWGQEQIKITIEDPTGNSAIISEKAVKKNLKA
ncbi:ZPR1 zinc finger domain-containing protein [Candidatus Woesearchaeota archaeon]|nr:MAG: ZPR1 zinc finger domain-containing protein [Candidatus Woesearchaeota archaeon]